MTRSITTLSLILLSFICCNVAYAQSPKISVNLENIGKLDKNALLQSMSIYRYREYAHLNDSFVQRLAKKGVEELRTSLQTVGYYQPEITTKIDKEDNNWLVTYAVKLGPPIIISDISIKLEGDGAKEKSIVAWKKDYPLHKTDILNQLMYESAKTELQRSLFNSGYFDYAFDTHQILINPKNNTAKINLSVSTGIQYRFGDVTFKQKSDYFTEKYLHKFLSFKQGDYFTTKTLIESQQNFTVSDEFQNVEIEPVADKRKNGTIPITVTIEPKKPLKLEYGIGYSTDTGPRASGKIERRRLTRSGHRANASFQYSRIKSTYAIGYRIPINKPFSDFLSINSERDTEDSSTSKSQKNIFSITTTYVLPSWLRTIYLNYEHEHYELSSVIDDSILLIPGISFNYLNKTPLDKDKLFWQFNISAKGAYDRIVSDTSFAQAYIYALVNLPIKYKSHLILRTSIGRSRVAEFQELPATQRFFTGGDYTVRGYSYNSLGPKDANGTVVGGENLLVGSIEYQHQIFHGIFASLFYDTGNAYNGNNLTLKSGSGIGFGWVFPFGSINLYRAVAISEPDRPWRYHLTIGASL